MSLTGELTIDLAAIVANWRALDALTAAGVETAAVLKADAYGCGAAEVAPALAAVGARSFFVAQPAEGARLRRVLGPEAAIYVLGGYPALPPRARRARGGGAGELAGPGPREETARLYADARLRPVLNAPEQIAAWLEAGAPGPCALQIDTGMNRLGLEAGELAATGIPPGAALVMSHLATADTPDHPMNRAQAREMVRLAGGLGLPLSLAATGGILLGPDWHFDMVRPGIGLFGGLPFAEARPVVRLDLPILQVRDVAPGEAVGYGATWRAARASRIATLSAGYADGLHRILSGRAVAYVEGRACPFAGRVSMDLIGLDVTGAPGAEAGAMVEILGPHQGIDGLAAMAETIGYEVLTALGPRYGRRVLPET